MLRANIWLHSFKQFLEEGCVSAKMDTKECRNCCQVKSVFDFETRENGYSSWCKKCKEPRKEYLLENEAKDTDTNYCEHCHQCDSNYKCCNCGGLKFELCYDTD